AATLEVEAHVRRHLVVAAPRGVELAADRPDARRQVVLDVHVDVLVLLAELEPARPDVVQHPAEALLDGPALLGREDPLLGEHARVGDRARYVLLDHGAVDAHRGVDAPDQLVGGLGEAAAPHRGALLRRHGQDRAPPRPAAPAPGRGAPGARPAAVTTRPAAATRRPRAS